MRKVLVLVCALGAASSPLAPIASHAASATPTSTASVTTSCGSRHTNAAVLSSPPIDLPPIVRATGFSGSALVEVELTPNGALTKARIAKSSGNFMVDNASLAAVRASTFRSETVDCVPVGGSYLVTAPFD